MARRLLFATGGAIICALVASCAHKRDVPLFNYEVLNQQASQEYLKPVHPGQRGETPFWNPYAFKFIYAPAFDFDDVNGAVSYVYTATDLYGVTYTFSDDSPRAPLSEIWNDIPVGPVSLSVQAFKADSVPVGEAQTRSFEKDNPFEGPYSDPPRSYREAALKAAEFIHKSSIAQGWTRGDDPDMDYMLNCYPNKIWSGTIQAECFLSRHNREYREEALNVARTAADALIRYSQPQDGPLPFFPPTYYTREGVELIWYIQRVIDRNRDYTMFADAVMAADALLDLYDTTGEHKYFDHARHIAETYRDLQADDGSWPVKVNWHTGEPITSARCMPTSILQLAQRLKDRYGIKGFEQMIASTEAWLWENTISNFNFNGQFEDVTVADKAAYQNLTNCIAVDCIDYLLGKPKPSKKEIAASLEMARFAEDQFTRWHSPVDEDAGSLPSGAFSTPYVYEQYSFQCPIDASTVGVANAWMNIYEATGSLLALAKAKALVDSIVKLQDPESGCIPTSLNQDTGVDISEHWVNCTYSSIKKLMRLDEIL